MYTAVFVLPADVDRIAAQSAPLDIVHARRTWIISTVLNHISKLTLVRKVCCQLIVEIQLTL